MAVSSSVKEMLRKGVVERFGITGQFAALIDSAGNLASPAAGVLGRFSRGVADSVQAAGKVTAPALGAAIATLAAPAAGIYEIEIDVVVSNATDVNNMKMQRGGVDLYNPIIAGNVNISEHHYRVTLNGSQNLSINAVAAGAAGVVYQAQIIATRVE